MSDPRDDLRRLQPWLLDASRAAAEARGAGATWLRTSVLAGLVLRESLAGWSPGYTRPGSHLGWGDGGHAFGLVQCDRRFWELALRGMLPGADLTTPLGQMRFAAGLLAGAHRFLTARHPGSPLLVDRAAVASYNADMFKVDAQLEAGRDADAVTTGGDYGRDVLARADALERRPDWPGSAT